MSRSLEGCYSALICVHSILRSSCTQTHTLRLEHAHRGKALLGGWGLAASMFWQSGRDLWPHQTLRDEAVLSGGMVATNWHNLPSPTCQSLFRWSRLISVAQRGCVASAIVSWKWSLCHCELCHHVLPSVLEKWIQWVFRLHTYPLV